MSAKLKRVNIFGGLLGSYQNTICVHGWTKTVRPSDRYTDRLKERQILQYGYVDRNPRHYEEYHLIPLDLGGSPKSPRNLWPEPHLDPHQWGHGLRTAWR